MTVVNQLACELQMPHQESLFEHIKANAPFAKRMVDKMGSKHGKRLVICGAGPSLNLRLTERMRWKAHEVWACNSALPYLMDRGAYVTHGFGIDQGLGMLEDWATLYDVEYLVATSIHPRLRDHLLGAKRSLRWFHNYLGIEDPPDWTPPEGWVRPAPNFGYEFFLYQTLFKSSVQTQYGLNSVARALCMAVWLGFSKIRIYGSDCAGHLKAGNWPMPLADTPNYPDWLDQLVIYADGRTALEVYGPKAIMVRTPCLAAEGHAEPTECRYWYTRADMMITAQHLVDIIRAMVPGQVELMGDTLPAALMQHPAEFFTDTKALPGLDGKGAITGFTMTPEQAESFP